MESNFNIHYSEDFEEDLRGIYTHVAYNLQNPLAASELVNRIISVAEALRIFPKIHRVRRKKSGKEIRITIAKNFNILYSVDDGKNVVNILRALYGRRNIDSLP